MARERGTGCIFTYKGSSILWVKYHRWGKAVYESSHSTDPAVAEKLLKRRLAEIQTGVFVSPKIEKVRVEELAENFLRDYRTKQRKSCSDAEARWRLHLKPFFGGMRAIHLTTASLRQYIEARQSAKAKNATINRELAALRRMFHLGLEDGTVKAIPKFPMLSERDNVRKGFLTDEGYIRLAELCAKEGAWLRAMLEVGFTYGWRIGELLHLRVRQIDLVGRTIRLDPGTTKNDDGREVQMTGIVHQLLTACVSGKSDNDFVFTRRGKPIADFRGTWARVCEEAGVPKLLFHDLRRTAARNLRNAGIAEGVIMREPEQSSSAMPLLARMTW